MNILKSVWFMCVCWGTGICVYIYACECASMYVNTYTLRGKKSVAFIRFSKGCMIQNKEFREETNQCGLDIVELGLEGKQG